MKLRLRLPGVLVALAAIGLFTPAAADASHIQGGSINSKITSTGRLQGTVTFITASYGSPCTVGDQAMEMPNITVTNPNNQDQYIDVSTNAVYTRCDGFSQVAVGTFDESIAALFGSAPNGVYKLKAEASARVSGIINAVDPMNGGSAVYYSRVTKGLGESSSPVLNSGVANTVAKGYAYKQNLNGVDPDGTAVSYASRAAQTDGPAFDIVSLSSGGLVSMTAGQTGGYNDGDFFSYTVRVTDAAGDFSERDALLVVSGNNAPPSINGLPVSAVSAAAGGGSQNVNFTASDPNNANPKIDTVSLSLAAGAPNWVSLNAPAGNPANAALTINPPGSVAAGTYTFNIDAVDSDSTYPLYASEQVQVTVTNAVPNTTIGTKPSSTTNSNAASFTFTADEGGVTYECKLDSGSWASCSSPKSYTSLADGSHTFQVRATDGALQTDASPDSYTWTVDSTAPAAPTLGTKPASPSPDKSFTWSGPGGDATGTECRIDGGSWTSCTSPHAAGALADGSHTFEVRALDAAGNHTTTPASWTWTLDTTPPAVPTIGAHPATVTPTSHFEFNTPAGSTVECQVDGGAWAVCASPLDLTGLADGAHTFKVRSYDAAGNRSASADVQWTVDTGAPAQPVIESAPNAIAQVSTFAFTVSSGDTAECSVDGGAWATCVSPFTPAGLADGAHTFKVRYADGAGNRSPETSAHWTLDTTAPAAPKFISGPTGTVTAKSATFDWTSEAGGSFECSVDGGAWTVCAAPFEVKGLAKGAHKFAVRQTDAAGNVSPVGTNEWTVGDEPTSTPTTDGPPKSVEPVLSQGATVAVKGDSASVGCQVDNGHLASCIVDVYANVKVKNAGGFGISSKAKANSAAAAGKLVKIGTGKVKATDGAARLAVDITLNAAGRKLMADSLAGIQVVLKIEARTIEGPKLRTRKNAKFVPAHQLIVPNDGLFASGSSKLSPSSTKLLKSVAKKLTKVKGVRCIGHTDSVGTPTANEKLGLERARAVCAALKKFGVKGTISTDSGGERHPRATNGTVKGRALNRRVEISVRYR